MDDQSSENLETLRHMPRECLVAVMLEVRAEMLERGDAADEVAEVLVRMCALIGVDPTFLRRAMN